MDAVRKSTTGPALAFGVLLTACLVCLGLFLGKPFHIDDPLFLWAAEHIQKNPTDFYGFSVNWYFQEQPMWEVTKNPPLGCYYIALWASLFGWSELAIHAGFLLPALAALWGTYRLAERWCSQPLLAALITLLTPAFWVSSTNVMCDTLMLAFWVWAIVYWERGLDGNRFILLAGAGFLIGLGILTKYFAVSLVPLLAVYTGLRHKKWWGWWWLALLIPLIMLAAYQGITYVLYGQNLLTEAVAYSTRAQVNASTRMSLFDKLIVGLSFLGGCLTSALLYLPLMWSPKKIFGALAAGAVLAWGLYLLGSLGAFLLVLKNQQGIQMDIRWEIIIPVTLFALGGVGFLVLACGDFWRGRAPVGLLLLLWVVGTFIFTTFINWAINGRSILPLVPAVAILIVRRVDEYRLPVLPFIPFAWLILVPASVLGFWVTWADSALAGAAPRAAQALHQQYAKPGRTIWFEGHWGFEYYMKKRGGQSIETDHVHWTPGDLIVIPLNNYGLFQIPPGLARPLPSLQVPSSTGVSTMYPLMGAAFYAHRWGPLPFAFGSVPKEEYLVFEVTQAYEGKLQVGETGL